MGEGEPGPRAVQNGIFRTIQYRGKWTLGKGQKWERGFAGLGGNGALGLWVFGFGLGNVRGSVKVEVIRLYVIVIVNSLSCAAGSSVRAIWRKKTVYLKRCIFSKYAFLPGSIIY